MLEKFYICLLMTVIPNQVKIIIITIIIIFCLYSDYQ